MNKLIRLYNQNREIFLAAIVIIALVIIIIQVLNGIAKEEIEQKKNEIANRNSSTNSSTTISETNKSAITGENISEAKDKRNTNLIKTFVKYCNDGEIEKAYNMLSEECKELLYPSIEKFKTNYYERIFYIDRMYELENWYDYNEFCTYYIKYTEDVLASGNLNSLDNKGDYITVVSKENGNYINISSYVGRKISRKSQNKSNVEIKINWTDMYIDYSILNISIKNNTKKTICLDTKDKVSTTYLYDSNGVKYTSFLNEIADGQLVVYRDMTNDLNIKFNKIYYPERNVSGVTFSDIVLNYDEYKAKTNEKKVITIETRI